MLPKPFLLLFSSPAIFFLFSACSLPSDDMHSGMPSLQIEKLMQIRKAKSCKKEETDVSRCIEGSYRLWLGISASAACIN